MSEAAAQATQKATISRGHWVGFLALCLMGGSGWLIDNAWPSPLPNLERRCLHYVALGAMLSLAAWRHRTIGFGAIVLWGRLALASILLLGLPAALAEAAGGDVSQSTVVALFALVPVAVVVMVAAFGGGKALSAGGSLVYALAGLGGALLVLPFEAPGSLEQAGYYGLMALAVLVTAAASVWMYRLLAEFAVLEAAAVCCVANGLFYGCVWLLSARAGDALHTWTAQSVAVEVAVTLLFDLPQTLLLVWILREIAPARFAARFLLVPLITVLEGIALLRPEITLRMVVGVALVGFGAWRLLTAPEAEEEPSLMLR